jgi:hypothetical protein
MLGPALLSAQNLTGIWRGSFVSKYFGMFGERYRYEVQLLQEGNSMKGVTYSYRTTVFYGKADLIGELKVNGRDVMIKETRITEVKMQGQSVVPCVMTCNMRYYTRGNEEFLEGTFTSVNAYDKNSDCGNGTVLLTRVKNSDFKKEKFLTDPPPPVKPPVVNPVMPPKPKPPVVVPPKPKPPVTNPVTPPKTKPPVVVPPKPKPDEPKVKPNELPTVPTPKVLASRENKLVQTIITDDTEVKIDLYDNGEIDNDTVSVYMDKRLVVSRQRLSDKPITIKLRVDRSNPEHELVMVAENLGEIPPNTSLMIVYAGEKRYEVRIESNEQKNAVVRFRYQPPH